MSASQTQIFRLGMSQREIPRRFLAGILVFIALAVLTSAPAQADDDLPPRVGRVAELGGELFLAPQDAPDQWVAIGLNYPVAAGDNLWVSSEGRAEIDFGVGQFRLAGDTSLHVSRLDDSNFALYIAQGRVILRVRVLDPGETARIDAPTGQVALTRPGLYRVEVSPDGQRTQLAVREGEAIIDTGSAMQQVLPGQSAALDGTTPQYVQLRNGVATDGFDTWSANRDRRYERNRVNSPVSRQMVGAADLDEYGTWDMASEYGAVWYPANVAADWAPYNNGYWTEVGVWGPTWVDAAPWGYAPFHYGRWAHIHGRWGWCPGGYVARPVWAPALVGWVGGPGWRHSANNGAPVYGWVPLGWGEPYNPHWKGCSDACWARYNKPYAVNSSVRPNASPARFVNATAPGAVTAVSGSAFAGRKPVQSNRVAISDGAIASAPLLAAPAIHPEIRQAPGIKTGTGTPTPASTLYTVSQRQPRTVAPMGALPGQTVAVPAPPATGTPPPSVPTAIAKPLPALANPSVSTNMQPPLRQAASPSNPPPGSNPTAVPAVPVDAKPRVQPMPQPVSQGAPPTGAIGQAVPARPPSLPMREPRAPASLPVPAASPPTTVAAPPAVHPVPAVPASHVLPGAPPPAISPNGHPGEPAKAEKPAPTPRTPVEAPAK